MRRIAVCAALVIVAGVLLVGYRYQPTPTLSGVTCHRIQGKLGTVSVIMSGATWNRSLDPRSFEITGTFQIADASVAKFHGQMEMNAVGNAVSEPTYVSLGPLFRERWTVRLNSKVFAPRNAAITSCTAHVRIGSPRDDGD
jgi:hypothetical protein